MATFRSPSIRLRYLSCFDSVRSSIDAMNIIRALCEDLCASAEFHSELNRKIGQKTDRNTLLCLSLVESYDIKWFGWRFWLVVRSSIVFWHISKIWQWIRRRQWHKRWTTKRKRRGSSRRRLTDSDDSDDFLAKRTSIQTYLHCLSKTIIFLIFEIGPLRLFLPLRALRTYAHFGVLLRI